MDYRMVMEVEIEYMMVMDMQTESAMCCGYADSV